MEMGVLLTRQNQIHVGAQGYGEMINGICVQVLVQFPHCQCKQYQLNRRSTTKFQYKQTPV